MKQEMSILKWASLMLEEEVKTLSAIQEVRFIKHLLWKIDPDYFGQWEAGRGTQSFAQVITEIGKYFKQEIGTDIKQFIQTLNVFKGPMDLWELLLGIAIKGSNRGNNINLILDMDHNVQAELVGIVSSIIDKFGQEAANNKDGQPEDKDDEQPLNEHQLMVDLMKEHEQLTNRIIQLQAELYKEQQQTKNVVSQKKELQQQIFMYKLEKASFLQTLANGNRSDSRIFDDGEETVLQTGNLTELANDIIVFVRDLRRRVNDEMQKNSLLEEELRQTKYQAVRAAEENESYLLQLGNLNIYENQIDQLRQQINEVFNENALLIDRINQLEEDKSKLILNLRKKRKESQEQQLEVEQNQVKIQEIVQKKRKVHFQSNNQQNGSNKGSEYQMESKEINRSEGGESEGEKNNARDELREPKLRTKLQRQIQFLKVSNETLKRQNSSLKLANENLQQSAREFLMSNQTIVRTWEEDFKMLIYQINQMGNEPQIEEQYELQNQEQQQHNPGVEVEVQLEQKIVEREEEQGWEQREVQYQQSIEQAQRQREAQKQKARELQSKLESITQEMNRQKRVKNEHQNEVELWREIAGKLKGLVARFRQNEINYQNTIYSLKLENAQLAKSLEQSLLPPPEKINKKDLKLSIEEKEQFDSEVKSNSNNPFQIKVQQINQENQGQVSPKSGPYMSFLSIKQGEELDEDTINKRNSQRSHFYKAESKIVKEIQENPRLHQSQLQQKYVTLNRRLFSESKASLFNLKTEFTGNEVAKTAQLQSRFQNEIKKMEEHYAWLNGSYQQLFKKLNIYTVQLRVKQFAKLEGMKLLEEIENEQLQTMENKESEIIKLTELNKNLRAALVQQAAKKQQLLQIIKQIESFGREFFKNRQSSYQLNLQKLMTSLEDMKNSFSQSLKDPMQFLQLRLQGDNSGKLQQFYNLYCKERQKNKQLTAELELLTSTLLEYRNILQF